MFYMAMDIIYVNENYNGEDAIGKMMHDFGCKESKDMYYPELAKGMRHFKEEGGRRVMSEIVERYAEKYAEQKVESARLNNLLEIVRNLMESMKWTAEQAMEAMKISESDKELLMPRL